MISRKKHFSGCYWHGHFTQDNKPCKALNPTTTVYSTNMHKVRYSDMHKKNLRHIQILKNEYDISSIVVWSCQFQNAKKGKMSLDEFVSSWSFHHIKYESIFKYLTIDVKSFIESELLPKRSCLKPLNPRDSLKSGLSSTICHFFDSNAKEDYGYELCHLDVNR